MKVTVDGTTIRISGPRGVDLVIYAHSEKDFDRFSSSLCYDGFEHGCLPSVEVSGYKRIVITSNLDKGTTLYK